MSFLRLLVFFPVLLSAAEPRVWLDVSATNLTVTETAAATICLRLPPLKPPFENQPPLLNQRPPHFDVPFLEQDWKPASLTPGDINQINRGVPRRGDDVRVYTLNKYVSNDIFSSMRDPFGMFDDDPFEAFGPRPQRFPFKGTRDKSGDWLFTITIPTFRAKTPGVTVFGAITVKIPTIDRVDSRGRASLRTITLRTDPIPVRVAEPPRANRPDTWCGAIGRTFAAAAALDANLCTAGDPLMLTLTLTGDCDPSTILPPDLSSLKTNPSFRLDAASVKSESLPSGGKRFSWRLRAIKAGTLEFPALAISYYDVAKRAYVTCRTDSIPLQAKAGAQAALGAIEEDAGDEFPQPDGLDLDFPMRDAADFTLRRALTLAVRAARPNDFAAAAQAYADYLSDPRIDLSDATLRARHHANLASLRFMAGDSRGALDDYDVAERAVGETPSTLRGIRACWARLRNDPRAELPLQRILFPFWYRYALPVRLALAGGILLGLVLLFTLAVKTGSRFALVLLCLGLATPRAHAQFFNFNFANHRGAQESSSVRAGRLVLEPDRMVVGEPGAFVLEFDVKKGAGVEQIRLSGLPEANGDDIVYGENFEPLTDGKSSGPDRVTRRYRLPVRFLTPVRGTVNAVVQGMAVTRTSSRFGSSSFANSFALRLPPLQLDVQPLPAEGRPADFTGAVGRGFRLVTTLSPDHVHPGDLVTATCTLTYDGFFPTNAMPRFEMPGPGVKVYELKEKSRKPGSVVWTQMFVPQTVSATRFVDSSVPYYDIDARKYALARAPAPKLTFVSAEKASTENTSVTINAAPAEHATPVATVATASTAAALDVRFAPAETSPRLFTLPPGVPWRELARQGSWRRIATPKGIGWTNRIGD